MGQSRYFLAPALAAFKAAFLDFQAHGLAR